MVASYFAQGAFKETMQALFVLAFVLALREAARNPAWREAAAALRPGGPDRGRLRLHLQLPGPDLAGRPALWDLDRGSGWSRERGAAPARAARPGGARRASALLAFGRPRRARRSGRMIDFHRFETFDPYGPGLGNLFGQISPFEALGIWPSGDFRLTPGDGAVPALGYYLGAAFATILLVYGLAVCWRRRESAVIAGLLAVAAVYAAARLGGTPYTAAKAIEVARADRRAASSSCRCCAAPRRRAPLRCSPRPAARCSRSPTPRSARPPTRRR